MGMGTANQAYLMTQSNAAQGHSPQDTRQRLIALAYKLRFHALRRPLAAVGAVLAVGVLLVTGLWDHLMGNVRQWVSAYGVLI